MKIYFSNRAEQLVEKLEKNLFPPGDFPLSPRLLVVPSHAIESWVRLELSKREIVGGFRSLFLEQALAQLAIKEPLKHPLSLTLQIEKAMTEMMETPSTLWEPLHTYLHSHENRKIPLCRKLATLFNRYALYGKRVMPHLKESWQTALWHSLFDENIFSIHPRQDLPPKFSLHLFGFSHLPKLYFHFFERLQKKVPVHIYHLSPCQEFWSDMLPERGKEDYFTDHHPMLVNLGRAQREFAKMVEESEVQTEECYVIPEGLTRISHKFSGISPTLSPDLASHLREAVLQEHYPHVGVRQSQPTERRSAQRICEKSGLSALHKLQQELLFARQESSFVEDSSLQIHISTTAHREIENLFQTLLHLLAEKNIEPKDVIVMAPDIAPYVPFIRAHFGEALNYHISDIPLDSSYAPLIMLLMLEKKRWSALALIELFHHPLFREKQRWKEEEIAEIKNWMEKASIRWGFDEAHRERTLSGFKEGRASWMAGFDHLLKELAQSTTIALTQAELLGQLITVVQGMFHDLSPFHDGTKKTLSQWCNVLKEVVQSYLASMPEGFYQKLLEFKRADIGKRYTFQTLYPLFKELLQEEGGEEHHNHLQAVRFSSMVPMRAIPARVIVLLGINHDAFPRKEHLQNLDLLAQEKMRDYYPTRGDFDRSLFLEAILSARDTLLISYLSSDGEKSPPSHLVSQLRSYCKQIKTIIHPPHPFDPRYFDPSYPELKNSSFVHYRAAVALVGGKEKASSPLVITCPRPVKREVGEIDLSSLVRLVCSPLKNYLEEKLDLRFSRKTLLKPEEEFHLSPLKMFKLKSEALKKPLDKVMQRAQKEGDFPLGSFGTAAAAHVTKDLIKQEELLKDLGIKKEQIEKITFPPLQLFGGEITLAGSVENVSPQGFLVEGECSLRSAIKYWPEFLVLNAFKKTSLIFIQERVIKEPFFDNPLPLLEKLLDYYFLSLANPSPLFPEWIDKILKNDREGLEKKMKESLSDLPGRSYDESMHWAFPSPPQAEAILEHWGEIALQLYGGIADGWF